MFVATVEVDNFQLAMFMHCQQVATWRNGKQCAVNLLGGNSAEFVEVDQLHEFSVTSCSAVTHSKQAIVDQIYLMHKIGKRMSFRLCTCPNAPHIPVPAFLCSGHRHTVRHEKYNGEEKTQA